MNVSALATDLYELTMMAGYWAAGMNPVATFELYVREMPDQRGYLVAAGLEQALEYLEQVRFTRDQIEYVRALPVFAQVPATFFDECLPQFQFRGEVWAVEEGTPIFPHEPFLRVTAPLQQAQLVETALLATVTFQTSVATKAARIVGVAGGRPVVEFGGRRAHGVEAGVFAARAAYLAGCASTSSVEAGFRFGIPVSGTMAHSWVMAFDDEMEAYQRYAALYGERMVLLIDTYNVMRAANRIARSGLRPTAVRLDSGEIIPESRAVRDLLDRAGLAGTGIFVSGDLDEYKIADLLRRGAPVSGFGVGTALSTSNDAPALGGVYKLVEIEGDRGRVARIKLSAGKASYAGSKQTWRFLEGGRARGDILSVADEPSPPGATALMEPVMKDGRRTKASPALADLRTRCLERVGALPEEVRRVESPAPYSVRISERLLRLTDEAGSRY